MAEGGNVEQINQVLVKQLASIHADGDNLTRRLHDLRAAASAASATVNATASLCREEMKKEDVSPGSPSPSSSSNKAVVRASRRRERDLMRDSLFNEDVTKLCALTKLLTEENQRLYALNCRYEAEMGQLRSEIQHRLDNKVRTSEADRAQEMHQGEQLAMDGGGGSSSSVKEKQGCLVTLVERQAWGMLNISSSSDEEQRKRVKSELERLTLGFVQGLIRIEDELLDKQETVQIQQQQQNEESECQEASGADEESDKSPQVMSYVLPAAALSGALAAIVISMRVSSATAASDSQQFL